MINDDSISVDFLLSSAFHNLSQIKRYQRLLDLALDLQDLEEILLLVETFQSNLNCYYEETEWNLNRAINQFSELTNSLD